MSISFSTIPADLKVPLFYAEFDNSRAGPSVGSKRTLLIGQATAVVPAALRYAGSAEEVAAFAGARSVLARMMAAYRANDPVGEVWILPVQDNGSGVAASGTIVVSGPATEAGTISLYVGGQLVSVAVANGDTANTIAAAINTALGAAPNLPVTAAVNTATVTLTAANKGTLGNGIDIRHSYRGPLGGEKLPAGVGLTITAMASGATDPVLTGVADILGDEEFDFICQPITATGALDAMATLMNDTAGRWSYARQTYGHVWAARVDTVSNLLTLGAARNDAHATILGVTDTPTPAAEIAAAVMGAAAVALKADPARTVQSLAVQGILAPPVGSRHSLSQKQSLLVGRIGTLNFGNDGSCSIGRAITTYRTNRFGSVDYSYYDVHTMYQLAEIVRRLKAAVTQKFPRAKLANDGTRFGPGQPVVTPLSFKAELVAQYAAMEAEGLVEDTEGFAEATIVQRNANDPTRLDVLFAPNLINSLSVLATLVQFRA